MARAWPSPQSNCFIALSWHFSNSTQRGFLSPFSQGVSQAAPTSGRANWLSQLPRLSYTEVIMLKCACTDRRLSRLPSCRASHWGTGPQRLAPRRSHSSHQRAHHVARSTDKQSESTSTEQQQQASSPGVQPTGGAAQSSEVATQGAKLVAEIVASPVFYLVAGK